MTDNEIIKSLEYCKDCTANLNVEIIDLIARQQAKIERLNKRIKEQKHALFEQQSYTADLQKQILAAKFEAVKEFVNRLKEKKLQSTMDKRIISMEMIDNLVKEMVGEDNA